MATSVAAIAAAMAAKARREICEHFEERDAFGPTQAIEYDPPSDLHRRQFESLVARGILLDTVDGRYWFDRAAFRAEEERNRAAAVAMLKILLIIFAIGIAVIAIVAELR